MKVKAIFVYGYLVGAFGFVAGFFGPIIFTPEANQGPLLGIFITGPLGVILGTAIGIVFYLVRQRNPEFNDPLRKLTDKLF